MELILYIISLLFLGVFWIFLGLMISYSINSLLKTNGFNPKNWYTVGLSFFGLILIVVYPLIWVGIHVVNREETIKWLKDDWKRL